MNNTNGSINRLAIPLILVSLPLTFMDLLLPMYTMSLGYTPVQITELFSVSAAFAIMLLTMNKWFNVLSVKKS